MTKQLCIIYDKEYKKSAEFLKNLLSQHSNIKASIYTQKKAEKFVSREKCIFIGKDCSSNLPFDDMYYEHGIHVGFLGAKAWVKCSRHNWTSLDFTKFESALEEFSNKYKAKELFENYKKDKIYIFRQFHSGEEPWPGNKLKRITDKRIANTGKRRFGDYLVFLETLKIHAKLDRILFDLLGGPTIRLYQYFLGVFTFYDKYLNDFLEISESTDSVQEESIENDEKKK